MTEQVVTFYFMCRTTRENTSVCEVDLKYVHKVAPQTIHYTTTHTVTVIGGTNYTYHRHLTGEIPL